MSDLYLPRNDRVGHTYVCVCKGCDESFLSSSLFLLLSFFPHFSSFLTSHIYIQLHNTLHHIESQSVAACKELGLFERAQDQLVFLLFLFFSWSCLLNRYSAFSMIFLQASSSSFRILQVGVMRKKVVASWPIKASLPSFLPVQLQCLAILVHKQLLSTDHRLLGILMIDPASLQALHTNHRNYIAAPMI